MTRQLTEQVSQIWRDLHEDKMNNIEKMWLQKYCMDYGAESVETHLMTMAKMGWYSLKSLEGLLKGTLSEDIRTPSPKPGFGGNTQPQKPAQISPALAELYAEKINLETTLSKLKDDIQDIIDSSKKTEQQHRNDFKFVLISQPTLTFDQYIEHLTQAAQKLPGKEQHKLNLDNQYNELMIKIKRLKNG